jgi:heme exporter protein A
MIRVEGLVKSFGHTYALRSIDLEVERGEFLAIIGPNGAGKTTLLRILATLLKPTSGIVRLDNVEISPYDAEFRRQIGFVSHQPLIYSNLTVEENLRFYARIYDVPSPERRVDELLDLVGLDGRRYSLAGTLSRGMQQRLSVARGIIHEPSILLLDEPYTGLDQQATRMLQGLLRAVSPQARTVIMTTHNLEQGLGLCDRLVMLSGGRIAFQSEKACLTLAELQEAYWQHADEASGWGAS